MSSIFARTRFIMLGTSHPGNVGSAARAMKTMGFTQLVLAAPKDSGYLQHPEAIALASGAVDVLDKALVCQSLSEALAPVTLSFALTARTRDMGPPAMDIRHAALEAEQHLHHHAQAQVAIILGPERIGLDNEEISRCHRICHIPANPEYSSLNVAQALQLAAWELRYAFNHRLGADAVAISADVNKPVGSGLHEGQASHDHEVGHQEQAWDSAQIMQQLRQDAGALSINQALAPQEQVEAFIEHWREALVHLGFLNPEHPKKLMPRMRYLFNRCHMTQEETDMMRGVCSKILKQPPPQY